MKIEIKKIEYYLPSKIEDGRTLKKDNPGWCVDEIEKRTGIYNRHISAPDETALDMAAFAGNKLFGSGIDKKDIGFLIFITQSPDYKLPTSACILQDRLGLEKSCVSFDVNLGCSGFIHGLAIGGAMIESGLAKGGLVLCAETYTKYIDKKDRACRSIFSDGAAAAFLAASKTDTLGPFEMGTDGSGAQDLILPLSGARCLEGRAKNRSLYMNGPRVFMFTMNAVPKCVAALLKKSGNRIEDIDLFIFHQASKVVMDNIIRRLKLPKNKVFINYDKIGNTVSASLPIALKDAVDEKRLKAGDRVMLVGFGVGFSWGACLIQWGAKR